MANKLALLLFLCPAVMLAGCVHTTEQAKMLAYLQPEQLNRNLDIPPDALYMIKVWVVLQGEFINLENDQSVDIIWQSWYGNGFGVDSQGRIMTNAHVVSPRQAVVSTMKSFAPIEYWNGNKSGIDIKSIDSINLVYWVMSLDYQAYRSNYAVDIKWSYDGIVGSPGCLVVENMELVISDPSGTVELVAEDEFADLAVIKVPAQNKSFLPLGGIHQIKDQDSLYNFALREQGMGKKFWPKLEIKWGALHQTCSWRSIENHLRLVTSLKMYCKFGNSGSAILDDQGAVVAVIVGKNLYQPETLAVPADYVRNFYLHAINSGIPKPELNCPVCIDTR